MSEIASTKTHEEILAFFKRAGDFVISGDTVCIELTETRHQRACVYAWVERTETQRKIIKYFGQTERGLWKRSPSWLKGPNGMLARDRILATLNTGSRMEIFVYEPNPAQEFGHEVYPQHAVEQLLIKICQPSPEWNGKAVGRHKKANLE